MVVFITVGHKKQGKFLKENKKHNSETTADFNGKEQFNLIVSNFYYSWTALNKGIK